ncbi:preprotein translocase [Streptomyces sp. CB00316]|uniref:sec-independent translocase n=1 Tax=unclassified Streptomyces TaxID=2593676 RepID=UPI0009405753|nr:MULTISPECIES: sec-independent translocase [unclassified Streptomyces]MBT2376373.1 Sec-independent protein translocase subunit TatB [Streptomyces sp. ISL-111]MBT2426952.1 Sec-independent protein translocase subunit TatB [Streptomyces sp. ISL-112]MBT2460626.1 Sec-independent protein translocase subunit TatB [Streptomyces sp. ISL-63]OKJ19872.1 preprotein translocase [Streptomyces sp. CB00316]
MFNDIGALELLTLGVLAVLVFGPEKLPKLIQDVTRTIRKIREFSDSAKEDIRTELGPQFKDFEFEDLNPKTFVRKQLMDGNDDLGLKEIRESFDLRKEIADVTDAVNGRTPAPDSADSAANGSAGASGTATSPSLTKTGDTTPDLLKKTPQQAQPERPPFDADAT